jgi:hypothetical protein
MRRKTNLCLRPIATRTNFTQMLYAFFACSARNERIMRRKSCLPHSACLISVDIDGILYWESEMETVRWISFGHCSSRVVTLSQHEDQISCQLFVWSDSTNKCTLHVKNRSTSVAFYGIRMFIVVPTRARYKTVYCASWIQSTPHTPFL